MNKLSFTRSLVVVAGSAFAQNNNNTVVRWRQIIGNITAPGIDNTVGGVTDANGNSTNPIHSGTLPWTTKGGSARVNLSTGEGSFEVEGLVLNGGNATGTTGPSKELKRNRLAFSFVKIREFSQRIVKQNRVQARRFSKIYPRFQRNA